MNNSISPRIIPLGAGMPRRGNTLSQRFSTFLLWLTGWKVRGILPDKKAVVIGAPHTSNYDAVVVVIGSGATADTVVPAMTAKAAHVTMLQRSPTYMVSIPEQDSIANNLRRFLPIRRLLLAHIRRQLGKGYDMKHFTPSYNPWDERLYAVPDGDMFKVLRQGKASVVTDRIETFTEKGILLQDVPNLAMVFGYTNASWTLKADISSE